MSIPRQPQKRLKKPPACDSCKARRVLCHPQPNNSPCPRCLEKKILCTTTPITRGRPQSRRMTPVPSSSLVLQRSFSTVAVASIPQGSALALLDNSPNCPSLTPEFVAHCFHSLEFLPQIGHPLIGRTRIKDSIHAAKFALHLLPPQLRAVILCLISVTSLVSFHESILGPGPRPESFTDHAFFLSSPDLRGCGVRRAPAHRALHAKAIKFACEIGVMVEPTEENALSCYLLDLLEQIDSCGSSRPWAAAYISHIRALAPRWRDGEGKYTAGDEVQWMGYLMSDALFATARRMPMTITLHDQLLLSGPEPPALDAFLESLETSKKPGLQLLWPSMKPYLFHVTCLARQLFLEINGDYPRLSPLSEAAVLRFLAALNLLHNIASLLLTRIDGAIEPSVHAHGDRALLRLEDGHPSARACAYGLIVGFISLVLPFFRELERRADEGAGARRARMQLFRAQARDIAGQGLHELARALRYLPLLHCAPLAWRLVVYPWAEFCVESAPENIDDLETITNELKMIGYSLDVLSAPHATQLIERLEAYLGKLTPQPAEDFLNSAELADLFLPLEQPWTTQVPKGMIVFDAPQDMSSSFRFDGFMGE
ncbi:hypothetical protein K438DRAFT_2066207 [Mycena galopus ATCC 62051]|nr:hypothetical protein K438DRAFT_2066207 [Mycena galopus ATCC 62051]